MIFGQDPPRDDPALKQPCNKLCNALKHKIIISRSSHFFMPRVLNLFFVFCVILNSCRQSKEKSHCECKLLHLIKKNVEAGYRHDTRAHPI